MKEIIYPIIGALLIGLSKAGFATGLGMLTTPLMATAISAKETLGVVLPLLCFADVITIMFYWKKWKFSLVKHIIIGAIPGIIAGTFFVSSISDKFLKVSIGVIGIVFVGLLIYRNIFHPSKAYKPSVLVSFLIGCLAGFTSTVSHAAGPIIAIFLLAQKPGKEVFVGSSAIYFTIGNLMKVPPYVVLGVLNKATLFKAFYFMPLIPIGVFLGWYANKHLPQKLFDYIVYFLLFVISIKLILPN